MSDETTQKVPGQGEGTPEAQVSPEEQSRTAVEPKVEAASQEGTDEGKPVTAKDLAAFEERMNRQIQSQVDKGNSRVQARLKEIDAAVAIMRKGGREITDADVKVMKQSAAAEALIEQEQAEVPEGGKPDPFFDMSKWDTADPVTHKVIDLQLKYGLEIEPGMPEVKMIERSKGPLAFLRSYETALKAAQDRTSASNETTTTTSAPAAARIPALGAKTRPKLTPEEKISQGLKATWTGSPGPKK